MISLKNLTNQGGYKLTTDDCYTPYDVYDVVLDWVIDKYNLQDDTKIVRPLEDIDKKLKLPTINTEEYVLELSEAEKAIIKTLGKGNNGTRSL